MNLDPFSLYFCRYCDCKMKTGSFKNSFYCDCCGHTSHQHYCCITLFNLGWNTEILKPIQKYGSVGEGLVGFQKLGILLDRIMIRRTKLEKVDELKLPPRVIKVRRDIFNVAEEELYASLYSDTNRIFNTYAQEGSVLNHYASIFSLLSRMRLAANHPGILKAYKILSQQRLPFKTIAPSCSIFVLSAKKRQKTLLLVNVSIYSAGKMLDNTFNPRQMQY
jgi:DNA repair protein RAD16